MSKRLFFIPPVIIFAIVFGIYSSAEGPSSSISDLRKKHSVFLKEKAPKKDAGLSRLEKIQNALPPNAYYEQMEFLTMNPALGYPEPYKVKELQEKLKLRRSKKNNTKAPGETNENKWISRGPNNVGGRTRVLLFDPNDATGKRVFAGAISGGLWVNNDITKQSSTWQQVQGLPSNLNVSCLTVDPRDKNTWYVGTGEQYTAGDVVGTGVFKTTDGGATWNKVLDVEEFATSGTGTNSLVVGGVFFINDIKAWDNGVSTEVFIGVSTHIYANAANPTDFLGFYDRGLYNTKDGGATWEKLIGDDSFNDFETDASGNLWVATTDSPGEGQASRGGNIYKRDLGENTSFDLITQIPDVLRTEIEASALDPNKFYILAEDASTEEAEMWLTTDAFATLTELNEPDDADNDITPSDFARSQAFYNLVIEADPTDDNMVYAGGIDLFRSTDGGASWQQISKWSENFGLSGKPYSLVHADQHVMQFRPGNSNQAVFGHDGGVSFASDLAAANNSDVFISPETDYITTQFYSVAVAPASFATNDYFLGGTQDNGTQLIQNSERESLGILGGDGAHAFFDQVDTEYFIANLVYNNLIVSYDYSEDNFALIANNEDQDGFFINPQALDSNLDKLFSNGPEGTLYRYDNLGEIKTVSGSELSDNDPVAPRVSFTNSLLDTSISAITVSPFEKNSSTVVLGLINGKLLKVENADGPPAQASWKNISGSQFVGSISDVEFGKSEAEIFVTFYNYGVKSVWYTENGLDANPKWVNKEGDLPDLPVLSILPNPLNNQEVIIGTELGVWSSQTFLSDRPAWNQAYNGMSDVKVTDLDLKKGNNVVFAASYGRGIYSGQFTLGTDAGGPEETPSQEIVVYPTVSDGPFNVISAGDLGAAEIFVFDLQGQLLSSSKGQIEANIPLEVDLTKEASGIYFLKVQYSGKNHVQKIIRK